MPQPTVAPVPASLVRFWAKIARAHQCGRRHAWTKNGTRFETVCRKTPAGAEPVRDPYRFPKAFGPTCRVCRAAVIDQPTTVAPSGEAGLVGLPSAAAVSQDSSEPVPA